MYYVYILESEGQGKYYIGSTRDLGSRIKAHNAGKIRSTKAFFPYRVVYKEEFATYTEARKKELLIKSKKSREFIKNLIDGV